MDLKKIKDDIREDLVLFGKVVAPNLFPIPSPEFHYELSDLLLDDKKKYLNIVAPRGSAKCLSGETDIYLNDGARKKIRDVQVGDVILSLNEDLKFESDVIVNKWETEEKPLFKIKTRSHKELNASADHKVLTFDGWKKVSELKKGDYIASPRRLPEPESIKERADEEVKFLGYLIAEGGTSDGSVRFTNFDEPIIEDFHKCVDSLGYKIRQIVSSGELSRGQYRVSGGVLDWTRENKLQGCKATNKLIPQWVFNLPTEQKWLFIAALWDTDGWFTKSAAGITLANKELVTQIQHLLWTMGVNSYILERPNDFSGAWALMIMQDCLPNFIENTPLIVKSDKAKKILGKRRYSLIDVYPNKIKKLYKNVEREFRDNKVTRLDNRYEITRAKLQKMIKYKPVKEWVRYENADVFWDRIESIEYAGLDTAYDVQVLKNENLLTNGLVTHNSTVVGVVKVLHHLMFGKGKKVVVLVSRTQGHAINLLQTIKDILDYSSSFRQLFGYWGVHSAKQWTSTQIMLKDGSSIICKGMGQMIRGLNIGGQRPDLFVLDDPEDENNTKTPESMELNLRWLLQSAEPTLDDHKGRLIVIGTPLHQRCLVETLAGFKKYETRRYKYINVDEDGNEYSLWEEKLSVPALKEMKKQLEELGKVSVFYKERQCEVIGDEDQLFKPEYLRYWDGSLEVIDGETCLNITHLHKVTLREPIKKPVNVFMGIDPASSTNERADFSVIMTIAYDKDRNIYVLPYFRKRVTPTELANEIVKRAIHNKVKKAGIETTGYQEMLRETVRNTMREKGYYITGLERDEGFKPRTEKNKRLEGLHPFFYNKKVYLQPSMRELEDELLMYPRLKNDDLLDGLYYATRRMYEPDHQIVEKKDDLKHYLGVNFNQGSWKVA